MRDRIELIRYALARWLIHTALAILPHNIIRRELHQLLTVWGLRVTTTVAAKRSKNV